jgi:23S rRNA (uracil747-C5)-methyltransferase
VAWDLYCGVGGFALHAAAPGRTVVGVETSSDAVTAARASLAAMPGAGSVEFVVGDATNTTPAHAPQLVVVNPPRRGIGPELAAWLEASAVRHVIYSSCNVVSLTRDLAAMPSLRAVSGRVFDMFPQTPHTEVMVLLERVDAQP